MNAAVYLILGTFVIAIIIGLTGRRVKADGSGPGIEEWSNSGRGMAGIFVFLLLAGETQTTFAFLGGSGFAYGVGGPVFYIMISGTMGYIISYWVLPAIWRRARSTDTHTIADLLGAQYNSSAVAIIAAVITIIALIPYISLQFEGLGIIIFETSRHVIPSLVAKVIALIGVSLYVVLSGIRGSTRVAVLKDVSMFFVLAGVGFYLPYKLYGGVGEMFHQVQALKPGFMALPATGDGVMWYITSALLSAGGWYLWPHLSAAAFSSASPRALRRSAIALPLYDFVLLFVMFIGFTAVLAVPKATNPDLAANTNLAAMRLFVENLNTPTLGLLGMAGMLTALVPVSILTLSAATTFVKGLVKPFSPNMTDSKAGRLAQISVPFITFIAFLFTLFHGGPIVLLLLLSYGFITQLAPGLYFSFSRKNPLNKWGVCTGLVVGSIIEIYMEATHSTLGTFFPHAPEIVVQINPGFFSVIANLVLCLIVSWLTRNLKSQNVKEVTVND